ncbi:MAG: hypothetical protein ACYS6W_14090 [Planctomycetota bacterium]|jgi:hypothetical protein
MIKRISCRVVRTVPLGRSSDALRHGGQPGNEQHRIDDAATVNIYASHNGTFVTYTGRLDTAGVSMGDSPMGQILDCYV